MTPEERQIEEARAGSREAMDQLAIAYTPSLKRFVSLMGVDDVDDVTQEILTQSFKSLASYRRECKFASWMLGIALNFCRNWRKCRARKKDRTSDKLDGPDPRAPDRSVLSSLVKKENAGLLSAALEELPPTLREAFILKFVEDLDYREISELLGTSEGTARVRSHRAKLMLRSELGPSFMTLLEKREDL